MTKVIRRKVIEDAINVLVEAIRASEMETAEFGNMWLNPDKDPLPTKERDVTDFIRKRTYLYRDSWITGPLREVVEKLRLEYQR